MGDCAAPLPLKTMLRIRTASTGPMEHRAIRPKESSEAFLSLRMAAMPTPKLMINGTVMGPVVTPPESKAMARKFSGARNTMPSNKVYKTTSSRCREIR